MARTLTPEEMEAVRLTEIEAARKAAARATSSTLVADEGQVKLYDRDQDGLKFGPGTIDKAGPFGDETLIVFGTLEPGVCVVRADHPLLPELLRRFPHIVVMNPGEVYGKTYACEMCDGEFNTKRGLQNHRSAEHPAPPKPATRPAAEPRGKPATRPAAPDEEADPADPSGD